MPGIVRNSWTTFASRGGRDSTSGVATSATSLGTAATGRQLPGCGAGSHGSGVNGSAAAAAASASNATGTAGGPASGVAVVGNHATATSAAGGPTAAGDGSQLEVTIDTSKARSTADVVRMCIRDLGWKEVSERWKWRMFGAMQ